MASLHPVPSYIPALQTADLADFTLLLVKDPLIVEHQALPQPHSHPVPESSRRNRVESTRASEAPAS